MATTGINIHTHIPDAEPYKGDDWAQSMSRYLATPMFVMGVMAVAAGLVLGVAGGVQVGDYFGALKSGPDLSDLGRGETLSQWVGAVSFLGMGFILSGVAMYLVNIVRTLRDAGRDVQQSLQVRPLKLRKPWTGVVTPYVMLTGVMVEVAAFVVGIVAAVSVGDISPAALVNPGAASAGDLADLGVARAAATWLPGLRFFGVAVLLSSVVLVLVTIQRSLRFQASRITEIADAVPARLQVIDVREGQERSSVRTPKCPVRAGRTAAGAAARRRGA
jgi:hypothetical membrane protein